MQADSLRGWRSSWTLSHGPFTWTSSLDLTWGLTRVFFRNAESQPYPKLLNHILYFNKISGDLDVHSSLRSTDLEQSYWMYSSFSITQELGRNGRIGLHPRPTQSESRRWSLGPRYQHFTWSVIYLELSRQFLRTARFEKQPSRALPLPSKHCFQTRLGLKTVHQSRREKQNFCLCLLLCYLILIYIFIFYKVRDVLILKYICNYIWYNVCVYCNICVVCVYYTCNIYIIYKYICVI